MKNTTNVAEPSAKHQIPAGSVPMEIPEYFKRFTVLQRAEHYTIMILFTLLVVTGFPQKFFEPRWAALLVGLFGGIDNLRLVHRIAGILFALLAVWHLSRVILLILLRKIAPSMIPTPQDFRDAVGTLKYYMGMTEEYPPLDRYDFRQKFEYIGLLMGGMVMIFSGFVLLLPIFFTSFLPGVVIPLAKTTHGYESILAFSVILIWHMYGAIFSPEVFPLDTSIFTGKISRERLEKEHPLEYERLVRKLEAEEKLKSPPVMVN